VTSSPGSLPAFTSCYLDTSLLSAAIVGHSAHHPAAQAFCEHLIAADVPIVVSELVYLEYANFLRTLVGRLPPAVARSHGLHRWERSPPIRERWLGAGMTELDTFMRRFAAVDTLALTQPTIDAARLIMATCNLASYDAAHVVTALSAGASHLAAVDDHFSRAGQFLEVAVIR
jgi:predicted nucleic acid-binding protein